MRICLVVAFAGCISSPPDVDSSALLGGSNGFGYYCVEDTSAIITPCYGNGSAAGWCDANVCYPACRQTLPGCDKHWHAVYTVESQCVCEPNVAPWERETLVPAMGLE